MVAKQINLAWVVVSDLDKAVEFYTDVVGMELNNRSAEYGWAELSARDGGAILGVAESNDQEPMKPGSNAVVTISVGDIEEARQKIASKGAQLVGDVMEVPGHVKLQTFTDADGNQFQLVQKLD